MNTVKTLSPQTITIDMMRDQVRVIETRGASTADLKKAFAKVHRITNKLPLSVNTAAELKKSRESRGKL